jgi:hypothetical protein
MFSALFNLKTIVAATVATTGIALASQPAKADHRGNFGVSVALVGPTYCAPVTYYQPAPVYAAPVYTAPVCTTPVYVAPVYQPVTYVYTRPVVYGPRFEPFISFHGSFGHGRHW